MINKITTLFKEVLSPVITDIKLDFEENHIESIIPNPKDVGYIIKNEAANFFVLLKDGFKDKTVFKFEYRWNNKVFKQNLALEKK
jgi:hypothetical protein